MLSSQIDPGKVWRGRGNCLETAEAKKSTRRQKRISFTLVDVIQTMINCLLE